MVRFGVVIAIVFVAGLAAGALFLGASSNDVASPPSATPATDTSELDRLRAELKRLEEDRALLAARNDALEADAATLRNDQELMDAFLQDAATAVQPTDEGVPPTAPGAPPRRGPGGDRDEWRDRPQPTPEQMEEFRKRFEQQQADMRQRIEDRLAQMNDPNAINNFNALLDLQEQERDLRMQMRDAKTDGAREKIEEQLRATRESSRQLLRDQQDSMFQSLAAANGIKDTDAQQKFVEDLRATLDNPFFRMESMLGGGGGPRGGGGFPGPRRGDRN